MSENKNENKLGSHFQRFLRFTTKIIIKKIMKPLKWDNTHSKEGATIEYLAIMLKKIVGRLLLVAALIIKSKMICVFWRNMTANVTTF